MIERLERFVDAAGGYVLTAISAAVLVLALAVVVVSPAPAQLVGGGTNRDLGPLITLSGVLAAGSPVFSADQINASAHAVKCVPVVTAVTGSLTVTIYGKDATSGTYYTLLAGAAINSVTTPIVLTVGPGLTVSTNVTVNDYLPPIWRVGAAVVTGPVTGTVGCSVIE